MAVKKKQNEIMKEEIKEQDVVHKTSDATNTEEMKKTIVPESASKNKDNQKKKIVILKEVAVANGYSLKVSTKNSTAICKMIMRKSPERAIEMLELVLKKKMAVPMIMDEIPHRKRGLMPGRMGGGGRFPEDASVEMINLLKQLKANCVVNGVENPIITLAVANLASRPFKKEGRRAKRTHIHLEARDRTKLKMRTKKK